MADDISNKLKTLLENPEMMNLIGNLASGLNVGDASNENSENADLPVEDTANTIKTALQGISTAGDNRITLLSALKPYMRESRTKHIDTAIKVLKMSKLSSVFKDL